VEIHRSEHTVASVGGTCVATVTAYIGNRYWVFRDRPADARRREMAMFALISLIGLIIENSFVFVGDGCWASTASPRPTSRSSSWACRSPGCSGSRPRTCSSS